MEIAGSEYGYQPADCLPLLEVLDVVQADASRCGGITGFLEAHALCAARGLPGWGWKLKREDARFVQVALEVK